MIKYLEKQLERLNKLLQNKLEKIKSLHEKSSQLIRKRDEINQQITIIEKESNEHISYIRAWEELIQYFDQELESERKNLAIKDQNNAVKRDK